MYCLLLAQWILPAWAVTTGLPFQFFAKMRQNQRRRANLVSWCSDSDHLACIREGKGLHPYGLKDLNLLSSSFSTAPPTTTPPPICPVWYIGKVSASNASSTVFHLLSPWSFCKYMSGSGSDWRTLARITLWCVPKAPVAAAQVDEGSPFLFSVSPLNWRLGQLKLYRHGSCI